jgi:hypothetical protein
MISVYFIHSHISFRFSLQVAGCGLRVAFLGWGHEISRKKILFLTQDFGFFRIYREKSMDFK